MLKQSTKTASCTAEKSHPSKLNRLADAASSFQLTPILANAAASALVIASAGFGAVYAWTTGSQHGAILGGLFVLMAIALEVAKPLAVASSFVLIRKWSIIRAGALALLAVVAIGYSLSAELSLMATARGDRVAERAATSDIANKARNRYKRAELELDRLAVARPSAELQAKIEGLLRTPGADGCSAINGRVTKAVCPLVDQLKAEEARAQRRGELEATMREAERELVRGPVAKSADPGAAALATYLAIFGFKVETGLLTELLILIGVLALEVGSALAGVLAMSLRSDRLKVSGPIVETASAAEVSAPTVTPLVKGKPASASVPKKRPKRTRCKDKGGKGGPGSGGQRMPANVVDLLKAKGGRIEGGQRGIGKLLGIGKSRANELLHELAAAGAVILSTSKSGTTVQLAAA